MKITPLEIRQKSFEKKMRGYSKEDVDAFLQSLSYEWERINSDKREMQKKIDILEKDVNKLREVESSLYKTLKTAELTGSNMVDQATKQADLHLREAQMSAEALLNEAKQKAKDTLDETDELVKHTLLQMRDELIRLEGDYRSLEGMRDNLLQELKNISNDTLERANKLGSKKLNMAFQVPEIQTPSLNEAAKNLLSKKFDSKTKSSSNSEISIKPIPEPTLIKETKAEAKVEEDIIEPITKEKPQKETPKVIHELPKIEEDEVEQTEHTEEDKIEVKPLPKTENGEGSFFDSL